MYSPDLMIYLVMTGIQCDDDCCHCCGIVDVFGVLIVVDGIVQCC
jgi:hypothetical protein